MAAYSGPYQGNFMWKSFTKTWHNTSYPQISPHRSELQLTDKVVFITGGGTGIGKATAIAFAEAGVGAVAIFGRRKHKLESAAEEIRKAATNTNFKIIIKSVDLSHVEATTDGFVQALIESGTRAIDVFISNAASAQQFGKMAGYDAKEFRNNIELNAMGTFNAIQAALPLLAHDARVIDVNSGIGHIRPIPEVWLYASLKAMNIKIFSYLQAENPGLSVFSIQPGVVATELSAGSGIQAQDDVELPAHFQVWLASPEAEFLKGKFVWSNWDADELKAHAEEIKSTALLEVNLSGVPM